MAFVYIMASRSRTLYIGVTSDLQKRVWQHKNGTFGGFTSKYRITRLVYYEEFVLIQNAIEREKQLKLVALKEVVVDQEAEPNVDRLGGRLVPRRLRATEKECGQFGRTTIG